MVVVHARRGGGLDFAIDQTVEVSWPQSAPDGPTEELLWDGLSAFGSWIYSTGEGAAGNTGSSAGETDDSGSVPSPPQLTVCILNFVAGIYSNLQSRRVERFSQKLLWFLVFK